MHEFLYCLQGLQRSDAEKTGAYQNTPKSYPGPKPSGTRPGLTMQQSTSAKVAVAQSLPQRTEQKGTVVGGLL